MNETASNGVDSVAFTLDDTSAISLDDSPTSKCRLDQRLSVQRAPVFHVLQQLAGDNAVFFQKYTASSPYSPRIVKCCREISRFANLAGGSFLFTLYVLVITLQKL